MIKVSEHRSAARRYALVKSAQQKASGAGPLDVYNGAFSRDPGNLDSLLERKGLADYPGTYDLDTSFDPYSPAVLSDDAYAALLRNGKGVPTWYHLDRAADLAEKYRGWRSGRQGDGDFKRIQPMVDAGLLNGERWARGTNALEKAYSTLNSVAPNWRNSATSADLGAAAFGRAYNREFYKGSDRANKIPMWDPAQH